MNGVVICDIDGILMNFVDSFGKAAKDLGFEVPDKPNTFYGLYGDLSAEQIASCFRRHDQPDFYEQFHNVYPGAVEGLSQLKTLGLEIRYLTDRPKLAHNMTYKWLYVQGFPNPEGLTCCDGKIPFIEALLADKDMNVLALIDDKPSNLAWARYSANIPVVCGLKHSYNDQLTDLENVQLEDSWEGLSKLLSRELPSYIRPSLVN